MIAPLWLSLALVASTTPPICSAPTDAAGVCQPEDDAAIRERLAPLLGTIDRPVPAEEWRRLPPGALRILEELAQDPRAFATQRALALDGAAALGSDGRVHLRLAADATTSMAVRHAAIQGLPTALPAEESRRALGTLLSADPDRRVRATAATVLARTFPGRACVAVRAQVLREGEEGRGAFRHALSACGAR